MINNHKIVLFIISWNKTHNKSKHTKDALLRKKNPIEVHRLRIDW